MEKFKETKNIMRYQGGVEIELHQRYGDLEPYDVNEAETYFTGSKIYICRCIHCGRVINASRENLLYGNQVHCGCVGGPVCGLRYSTRLLSSTSLLKRCHSLFLCPCFTSRE